MPKKKVAPQQPPPVMLSPAERARLLEANFGPSMDILDLEDAAKTLVRPALMLGPTYGPKTVGVWEGTVDGQLELLTIDLRQHPDPTVRRAAILRASPTENLDDAIAVLPRRTLSAVTGGVKLGATPSSELPPFEVLVTDGPGEIQRWLRDGGWTDFFPSPSEEARVESEYRSRRASSFRVASCWAQLGGWPRERHDSRLVLCAHHGAEPWLEVVLTADGTFEAELLFHD